MWQVVLGKNRWDKISGLPDSIFSCHKLKVKAICCFVTTALASFLVFYSFLLFFHPPTSTATACFPKFLSGTSAISLRLGKNSKMNWSCFLSMCVCWLRHITLFLREMFDARKMCTYVLHQKTVTRLLEVIVLGRLLVPEICQLIYGIMGPNSNAFVTLMFIQGSSLT